MEKGGVDTHTQTNLWFPVPYIWFPVPYDLWQVTTHMKYKAGIKNVLKTVTVG